MSCNYAEGLSPYNHKGKLGLPEVFDDSVVVEAKVRKLAEWIKGAKHTVVHTGAGISTAAGIPDFRGPNGVWTLEEKGLKPNINISFDLAQPTLTHMALTSLINSGHVKYIVSQNIDGLHLRSGLKRNFISELHGNMFVAKCSHCDREFIQKTSVPTVGQKEIGLDCLWVKAGGRSCRGKLHDNILDWEHNLPDRDLEMADMHSSLADLSICLGTTLQIVPAGNLPLRAKKNNGKVVIVNLQPTKHHKKADLVIHTQVDRVLELLAQLLGLRVTPFSNLLDPTYVLRHNDFNVKFNNRLVDWTIPVSSVSKLKKVISALKDKSTAGGKASSKPKNTRKRRRTEQDESSESEEDQFFEGDFANGDFQSFVVKEEKKLMFLSAPAEPAAAVVCDISDDDPSLLPLDLSSTSRVVKKEDDDDEQVQVKIEPLAGIRQSKTTTTKTTTTPSGRIPRSAENSHRVVVSAHNNNKFSVVNILDFKAEEP